MKPKRLQKNFSLEKKKDPWLWAYRAREEFVKHFLKKIPVRGAFKAIVVGAAQEGKTTFILRLLGANPDEALELSKVLRAGRSYGQSATQAPLIYKPVGGPLTEQALLKLEEQVKYAYQNPMEVHTIELPLEPRWLLGEEVIDLVGLNPADPEEGKRAEEIVERLIALAPLRFYVTDASHLSNLDPTDPVLKRIIGLSLIRRETSFIVLTAAFERLTEEELENLRDKGPEKALQKSIEYFSNAVLEQLRQSNPQLRREDIPHVLPVSFGSDSDIDPLWKEVTEIALKKVRDVLGKNEPYELMVKSFFDTPIYLRSQLRNLKGELHGKCTQKDKIEEEIEKLTGKIKEHIRKKNELKYKIMSIIERLEQLHSVEFPEKHIVGMVNYIINQIVNAIIDVKPKEESSEIGYKVEKIRKISVYFAEDLISTVRNTVGKEIGKILKKEEYVRYKKNSKPEFVEGEILKKEKYVQEHVWRVSSECSRKTRKFLHERIRKDIVKGRVIVEGWFGGVKWNESINNLKSWAEKVKEKATGIIKNCLEENLKKICTLKYKEEVKKLKNEKRKAELGLKHVERKIKNYESRKKSLLEEKKKIDDEISNLNIEIETIEIALKKFTDGVYEKLLAKNFVNCWNQVVDELNRLANPVEILEYIAYLYSIGSILDELQKLSQQGGDNHE